MRIIKKYLKKDIISRIKTIHQLNQRNLEQKKWIEMNDDAGRTYKTKLNLKLQC